MRGVVLDLTHHNYVKKQIIRKRHHVMSFKKFCMMKWHNQKTSISRYIYVIFISWFNISLHIPPVFFNGAIGAKMAVALVCKSALILISLSYVYQRFGLL